MAVKPWVGDLKASSPPDFKITKNMSSPPDNNLQLMYVNGYRCFDTRNAAKLTAIDNTVCFISAALGVVMDVTTNTQTFFN